MDEEKDIILKRIFRIDEALSGYLLSICNRYGCIEFKGNRLFCDLICTGGRRRCPKNKPKNVCFSPNKLFSSL